MEAKKYVAFSESSGFRKAYVWLEKDLYWRKCSCDEVDAMVARGEAVVVSADEFNPRGPVKC